MIGTAIDEGIENGMLDFDNQLERLLKEAATYGAIFKKNEDDVRFEKIKRFAEKLIDKEYMIGFAGHFSAGKSSMINALTGVNLLPSSPIPTSANIVKVHKAETDYAIVYATDGTAVKYEGDGFADAVKSFSLDGAAVSLVEIGHQQSVLPEGITVMDTPGVDSTDDAHRLSTESALHLADLVFYTMDYNHVQSELNFSFTKELLRYNPNVYLIINQIDKHRESEISFAQFQQSVEASFKLWGVEPQGIFYTSLRDHDHPHNDFGEVKAIVEGAMVDWQQRYLANAEKTMEKLRDEHEAYLNEEIAERKDSYSTVVSDNEWHQYEELKAEVMEAKKTIALLSGDAFSRNFDKERNDLLQNASITPYETRELLKAYLESQSPRFKVGFLFGAKKTAEERERRKEAFSDNIRTLIHTQIEVHLKTLMKKSLKQADILTDDRSLAIDAMDMTIPFETIVKQFNATDTMTGDTVLNYSKQMQVNITHAFRQLTEAWKIEMTEIATTAGRDNNEAFAQRIEIMEEKLQAIGQVQELMAQLHLLTTDTKQPTPAMCNERDGLLHTWKRKNEKIKIATYEEQREEKEEVQTTIEGEIPSQAIDDLPTSDVASVVQTAQHIATVVKDVPGFLETAEHLKAKAKRLDNQQFTVALFGAFSAGKSSFSNALIGEKVLPVSPNPTTATINRIRPVTDDKTDGTADIVLKTVARMTEDVTRSFEALGIQTQSLEEAFEKADEAIHTQLQDEKLHIHKSFIEAFQKGYPLYGDALGTVLTTDREEFVKFVAEEERSCFVESIDFYYDCELTRKGITLVDTPGADSINARHTDVAFDYIRSADAILFVTYYNHAFARADREFLIQLGRVKDAFEMDKMFFIVNAIDLAADEEEAAAVQAYVANELQQFGIRHPRIHGLSSLQALEAKNEKREDPFMAPFEEKFHQFLQHDLRGLAVQALEEESIKTSERLASLITRTEANMLRKTERLEELAQHEEIVEARYAKGFADVLKTAAANELNELVYYIGQRVFLRFNDFFREAYNPAAFTNKSTDQALQDALQETVQMVGFDLTQELKVTNLRISNFLNKQLAERQRAEVRTLKEIDGAFVPASYETEEADLLSFTRPFQEIDAYKSVNKLFKNGKAFFERGEREQLKNRLEELLRQDTERYLNEENSRIEQWANQWIGKEADHLRKHLLHECLTQIESERILLDGAENLEEWRAVYNKIQGKVLV